MSDIYSTETQAALNGWKWLSSSYYLDGVENGSKATADIAFAVIEGIESNWEQFQGLPTQEVLRVIRAEFKAALGVGTRHFLTQTRDKLMEEIFQ